MSFKSVVKVFAVGSEVRGWYGAMFRSGVDVGKSGIGVSLSEIEGKSSGRGTVPVSR